MCDYCNPKGDVNIYENRDSNYPSREVYAYLNYVKLVFESYSSDGRNYMDIIPVNYCPMCGRKLC